jgi:hypothetical protein
MEQFVREFCEVLGDHFNRLGDQAEKKQPQQQPKSAPVPLIQESVSEDERRVQKALADPEGNTSLFPPYFHNL